MDNTFHETFCNMPRIRYCTSQFKVDTFELSKGQRQCNSWAITFRSRNQLALAACELVVLLSVIPKTAFFVANKGAVYITDFLFEVSLVPSEFLCPLWMKKFIQIG